MHLGETEDQATRKTWPWFVTLGFAMLMWLIASFVSYYADPEAAFWRAVIQDKRMRAEATKENSLGAPVIFVGGGSSCSFSVHPDVLSEVTGFQSVNLGGAAGMGYRYLTDLATAHARRGDIVILQLEPAIFRSEEKRMPPLAVKMDLTSEGKGAFQGKLYNEPVLEKLQTLKPGAKFLGVLAAKLAKRGPMYRYRMEEMRENGSLSIEVSSPNPDVEHFKKMSQWAKEVSIQEDLAWLARYADKSGVKIFYTLPWESYREENLDEQRREHAAYLMEIEKHIPVLRDPMMGAVGDNSLFLDTGYHMTEEGGRIRSRALGEALNHKLSEEK